MPGPERLLLHRGVGKPVKRRAAIAIGPFPAGQHLVLTGSTLARVVLGPSVGYDITALSFKPARLGSSRSFWSLLTTSPKDFARGMVLDGAQCWTVLDHAAFNAKH